ncbi:heterokaryon incompatibility protein-domain-containing protein [Lophiotrema nucula]|uniref:Heterokaryon incompatibility protein-domain-containing protein n=1 Tax=Lophiotrema nucula TaxID=690887 RepID=A0A6A5ZF07_9PLEO|nr:heterokaryon incompatibility protein-domain-containing protein [Lophiotrema nucula]
MISNIRLCPIFGEIQTRLPRLWLVAIVVHITNNLASALRQIRADDLGLVWVDALCINQKDEPEKPSQVQRIRSIYKSAKEVVAWLVPHFQAALRSW